MSTPHPDTQVRMMQNMLSREYEFHVGDKVEINSIYDETYRGIQTTVKFPYYYKDKDMQLYLTDKNPIPYGKDELILLEKNPNGKQDTMDYLNKEIERANSKDYRDNWVSA